MIISQDYHAYLKRQVTRMKTFFAPEKSYRMAGFVLQIAADIRLKLGEGPIEILAKTNLKYGSPVMVIDFYNQHNRLHTVQVILCHHNEEIIKVLEDDILQHLSKELDSVDEFPRGVPL